MEKIKELSKEAEKLLLDKRSPGIIGYNKPKHKSKIIIGDWTIYNTKKFNWLNRKMIKFMFGFKVEPIKENKI